MLTTLLWTGELTSHKRLGREKNFFKKADYYKFPSQNIRLGLFARGLLVSKSDHSFHSILNCSTSKCIGNNSYLSKIQWLYEFHCGKYSHSHSYSLASCADLHGIRNQPKPPNRPDFEGKC